MFHKLRLNKVGVDYVKYHTVIPDAGRVNQAALF